MNRVAMTDYPVFLRHKLKYIKNRMSGKCRLLSLMNDR